MRIGWVVFLKELRDAVRDRRAWIVVLVSALVAGPAALLLLSNYVSGVEDEVARREIVLDRPAYAPTLVNYLERNGARIVPAPADAEAALRAGGLRNAVFSVPPDFEAQLARGETVRLQVTYDGRNEKAQAVARAAMRLVQGFNREATAQRLLARGLAPQLTAPLELEERNLAPARAHGAQLLFIVPWVALLVSVAGAVAVAIDVTAGERERGSLEPLLMSPASLVPVVVGKWAAVAACGTLIAMLTLAGFRVALPFVRNETLAALLQFGPREMGLYLALLVPFSALMAAINMLAASYGRSFKEAQSYVSYIVMVVNLAPLAPLLLTLPDTPWLRLVPALAQQMALLKALRGTPLAPADVLLPAAVCAALIGVALAVQTRLLRQEAILFSRG
jgi:sodium transport system permease protein